MNKWKGGEEDLDIQDLDTAETEKGENTKYGEPEHDRTRK